MLWVCKAVALAFLVLAYKLWGWQGLCVIIAPFILHQFWCRWRYGHWQENEHQVIRRRQLLDSQKPQHLRRQDE